MKVTFKGDYALKAILNLAVNYNKRLVTASDMAKKIDAPLKFLEQVLLELKKGGFIQSKRGNIGGYQLSKPPRDITVGEIIRFIDGPIEPISCIQKGYSDCVDIGKCVFRKIWQDISRATSDIIDNVTFEDLALQLARQNQAIAYSI